MVEADHKKFNGDAQAVKFHKNPDKAYDRDQDDRELR